MPSELTLGHLYSFMQIPSTVMKIFAVSAYIPIPILYGSLSVFSNLFYLSMKKISLLFLYSIAKLVHYMYCPMICVGYIVYSANPKE